MTVEDLHERAALLRNLLHIKQRRLDGHLPPDTRLLLNRQVSALVQRIDQLVGECYRLDPCLLFELERGGPLPCVQPELRVIA